MNNNDNQIEVSTKLAVFKGKNIRKTISNNEWWFSIIDVVETLTESANPRDFGIR